MSAPNSESVLGSSSMLLLVLSFHSSLKDGDLPAHSDLLAPSLVTPSSYTASHPNKAAFSGYPRALTLSRVGRSWISSYLLVYLPGIDVHIPDRFSENPNLFNLSTICMTRGEGMNSDTMNRCRPMSAVTLTLGLRSVSSLARGEAKSATTWRK